MFFQAKNGMWIGDFWEHAAVVRELATHPWHPLHPQLALDAPHAFYSPYTLALGLIARAGPWDAETVLAWFGLVNLCLLFVGIHLFAAWLAPEDTGGVAFFTLLLSLCAWGAGAWKAWAYSGFIHLGAMGYVLPYPSAFAVALSLITLGLNGRPELARRKAWRAASFLAAITILLTHPLTFAGFAAYWVAQQNSGEGALPWRLGRAAIFLALVTAAATLWPYYPILRLSSGDSHHFHSGDDIFFQNVFSCIWPALLGVPLLVKSLQANRRAPVAWAVILLSLIYLLAGITHQNAYGRVISFVVLGLHFELARWLSGYAGGKLEERGWVRTAAVHGGTALVCAALAIPALKNSVSRSITPHPPNREAYGFLTRWTGQYEVVLSDERTSWIVPAFGGKIISTLHPLAFVADQPERRADLARFFDDATSPAERVQLAAKYHARYLLLDKVGFPRWASIRDQFAAQGKLLFENDRFSLQSISPP